nr:MAG TPA: hypothetical protein [Caudoviricetes sp.]
MSPIHQYCHLALHHNGKSTSAFVVWYGAELC